MRSAVRPRRTQAGHDHRSCARSSGDLPAVLLGKRKSIVWRTVDHADYPLRSVWRLQRPDIDGIGRAISDPRALDRARHCLQHCGHAVWRLCTVLRDLANPSDWHADRAGILSDVRRGGWTAGGLFPQGTSPRCEVFGHGRRRTNCRLVLTATSDDEFPLWVKTRLSANPKADIGTQLRNVRFVPKADIVTAASCQQFYEAAHAANSSSSAFASFRSSVSKPSVNQS